MVHLLKRLTELGLLVSGLSTFWEDTYGHAKQHRCDISIYVMAVLSYLYGIIMDCEINTLYNGIFLMV